MRKAYAIFAVLIMAIFGSYFLWAGADAIWFDPVTSMTNEYSVVLRFAVITFGIPFLMGLVSWWLAVKKSPRAARVQKKWWCNMLRFVATAGFILAVGGGGAAVLSLLVFIYEPFFYQWMISIFTAYIFAIGTLISVVAWYLQSGSNGLPDHSTHHHGGNNAN